MIKASNTLSVNIMLEKQQVQLKAQHEENYKALNTVSALSSENLKLRNELQKKSNTIVSQNKKLKDQTQKEAKYVKSEEAKRAGAR